MEIKIQQYIMNNLIEIISYIYEQVTFPQISISIPKSMVPIPIAEISEKNKPPFRTPKKAWNLSNIQTELPNIIGSMYAIYGNIYHQYTPVMLAYIYIYHTWILWETSS